MSNTVFKLKGRTTKLCHGRNFADMPLLKPTVCNYEIGFVIESAVSNDHLKLRFPIHTNTYSSHPGA